MKIRTNFTVIFLVFVLPAFLVQRHFEDAGLVDSIGTWYTVACALAYSFLIAATVSFLLNWVARRR